MDSRRNADIRDELSCGHVREQHAEYMDGLLAPALAARMRSHLDECSACARYDRLVRRSVDLVQGVPDIMPSDDFEQRLQHRIFHVQDEVAFDQARGAAGVRAAAMVAGMIALLAWSPLLLDRGAAPPAPSVSVAENTPREEPVVMPLRGVDPLGVANEPWLPPQTPSLLLGAVRAPAVFPGPYSPLIVNLPVHGGAVRTISTEYRAYE